MSCERIKPRDFHSAEADEYSAQCVDALMKSKNFRQYVRHVEYTERLYLLWFVVPLGLLLTFYYQMLAFPDRFLPPLETPAAAVNGSGGLITPPPAEAPGLTYATVLVALYLLPCAALLSFVGFFKERRHGDGVWAYGFLTAVHLVLVSCGGPWFSYAPFVQSEPRVPWLTGGWHELGNHLRVAAMRVLPLQGYITAAYVWSCTQRRHWRSAYYFTMPLLSIPLVIGAWGAVTWHCTVRASPLFLHADGTPTESTRQLSFAFFLEDPAAALSLVWYLMQQVASAVLEDIAAPMRNAEPSGTAATVSSSIPTLFVVSYAMSLLYFCSALALPVVEALLNMMLTLLPTHPTTWGLSLLTSAGASIMFGMAEEVQMSYVMAPAALTFALLYNGFSV